MYLKCIIIRFYHPLHTTHTHIQTHSAGVGRSGVFCAISIVLDRLKVEGRANIYQTVKHLRMQRSHMVQGLVSCIHSQDFTCILLAFVHLCMRLYAHFCCARSHANHNSHLYQCVCSIFLRISTSFAIVLHKNMFTVI